MTKRTFNAFPIEIQVHIFCYEIDKEYQLTVLADYCADADEEVHRVLTTKVFPRKADILKLEEWIK